MATKGDERRQAEEEQFRRIYGDVRGGDDRTLIGDFVRMTIVSAALWSVHLFIGWTSGTEDFVFGPLLRDLDFISAFLRWPASVLAGIMGTILLCVGLRNCLDGHKKTAVGASDNTKAAAPEFLERVKRRYSWSSKVPSAAAGVVVRVQEHLASVRSLSAGDVAMEAVVGAIEVELDDLLERYNRVAEARQGIPDAGALGDTELLVALTQIEQAIVAHRRVIADAALHNLKVHSRFVELKHEKDGLN
jgi:hypothetical protein